MTEEEKSKRLKELEAKTTHTDAEMMEMIQLSPSGRYKILPNLTTLGLKDVESATENIINLGKRIKTARENGYYIETISLIMLYTEVWLKTYIIAKDHKFPQDFEKIYFTDHKDSFPDYLGAKTFGLLINECEKKGFKTELIVLLRKFNKYRNEAIHRFTSGNIKYDDLKEVCEEFSNLPKEISKYVAQEVGVTIILK